MGLRINFIDVIVDETLRTIYSKSDNAVGYEFEITLSNYRGHYLSCIQKFELYVDGTLVDPSLIRFCINGKEFPVNTLKYLRSEFWKLLENAVIKVIDLGVLSTGDHNFRLNMEIRVPYMPIPVGEHNYVPLNASGEATMKKGDSKYEN